MNNNLLVTRERLHRLRKAPTPYCTHCPGEMVDDRIHLFHCIHTKEVTSRLLSAVTSYLPAVTASDIINLSLPVTESLELPLTWIVSVCLSFAWEERVAGRTACHTIAKAEMMARIAILKETRSKHYNIHNAVITITSLVSSTFLCKYT